MRTRTRSLIVCLPLLAPAAPAQAGDLASPAGAPIPEHCAEHLRTLQDPRAPIQARHQAEDRLAHAPPSILPALFVDLDQPVDGVPMTEALSCPAMPARHMELDGYPAVPQIVYARLRVWKHLARTAQPLDERLAILEQLFAAADSDFKRKQLLQVCSRENWSPAIEQAVGAWFLDRTAPCDLRSSAAIVLGQRTNGAWRETVVQEAWSTRNDPCTLHVGEAATGYDPRLASVLVSRYERAARTAPANTVASVAASLGDYLKVRFTPPLNSPIEWLSDEWHETVIANARAWIDANREALEADARRAAQGETVENRFAQPGFVPSREEEAVRARELNLRRVRELQK